jgi:hypothetical protein
MRTDATIETMALESALADWCRDDPFCLHCGKAECECLLEHCDVCRAVLRNPGTDTCEKCERELLTRESEMAP